jgi:hypothetical protein
MATKPCGELDPLAPNASACNKPFVVTPHDPQKSEDAYHLSGFSSAILLRLHLLNMNIPAIPDDLPHRRG